MISKYIRAFSLVVAFCLLISSVPVYANETSQAQTKVSISDYKDLDGNIVGTKKKEITIGTPVYDDDGTKSVTITEIISYDLDEDFEFKEELQTKTRTTVFSTDTAGNNYINNELVTTSTTTAPPITTMDTGGHWKYTYYNCDGSVQCYLYTGSGVSFDLNTVHNAYKEKYLFKNPTNNGTISDFKLYATEANNAVDDYWDAGGWYLIAIAGIIGAIPFANAIAAIAAGGTAIYEAYQGYSAWKDLNDAMKNAYSLI